ncbi:MAG: AAA family ATPase, partial [Terriglobia bacterium]
LPSVGPEQLRYFASMGDAAWIAKQPADSVRAYYLESLALVPAPGIEAWLTFLRYLGTFSADNQERVEQALPAFAGRRGYRQTYVAALRKILTDFLSASSDAWREGLVEACAQSGFVLQVVLESLMGDSALRQSFLEWLELGRDAPDDELKQHLMASARQRATFRQQTYSLCQTLTRHQLSAASMEDLANQLKSLPTQLTSELDRRRVGDLLDLVNAGLEYCRTSDFEGKEQNYWLVTARAQSFRDQVKAAPTQLSFTGLLPLANQLEALTEEHYAEIARTSAAQLQLRLLVGHYVADRTGEIKLQIKVTNAPACSPASNVSLVIGPADSPYFDSLRPEVEVAPTIRGGSEVGAHITIRVKDDVYQQPQPAFPVTVCARFRSRVGEDSQSDVSQWTVRLYAEEDFTTIANPYAAYAEGGPVDEPSMFVGRESVLGQLERSLLGASNKCIVMFGQKRAGKSSLLEHLRRRLETHDDCMPIQFSLLELSTSLSEATFYYKVISSILDALMERDSIGSAVADFPQPELSTFEHYPTLRFHETVEALLQRIHRPGLPRLNIVLLIDEFTEIFKQIKRDPPLISPEFMKAWKSIVEKRYFSSVLVGQDIMPTFKAAFANEFGVTEDIRVTYLAEPDAKRLIQEPIGTDCYLDNAVATIIGLTAGSPFYTMMLCSRLVEYMNRTRSVAVTPADILSVEQDMVIGDRRLGADKFDNLIVAGDGFRDSGIDPKDTSTICADIARRGHRGWCAGEILRAGGNFGADRLQSLLTDLERRDVIECKGDAYRLRVGLFRDWLQNQL